MAHSVARRVKEIGVLMALSVQRRDILGLILGQGMRLSLLGRALGLAGEFILTGLLASMLYGIAPRDGATYGIVAPILLAVSFAACYIPAWRATRVDPMAALQHE